MNKLRSLTFLLSTILMLGLVSCSKEAKKISGKISFSASSLVAGVVPVNGIVLNGSNGVNNIQIALANPNDDVEVELEPGLWNFKAIAWNYAGVTSPLHGTTSCGVATADLSFGDFTVELNLNKSNCTLGKFGPSSMKRTDDTTQFKELVLRPCLYFNGLSLTNPASEKCYDTWKQKAMGNAYRIAFYNVNTITGLRAPGIISKCVDINSGTDGATGMQIPINAPNGSFPFVIYSYEDAGCTDEVEQAYLISTGTEDNYGLVKAQFNSNDTYDNFKNFFYFPDNFIGYPMTALDSIQPEDPSKCGGGAHCLNNDTGFSVSDRNRFERVKDRVFSVIGTPSAHGSESTTHSSLRLDDGGGNGIIVYKTAIGSAGGAGSLTLTNSTFALNTDNTTNLDLDSPMDIATLVTNINSSANYRAVVLDGTNEAATLTPGVYNFINGSDNPSGNRSDRSVIRTVSEIYGGPVGAVMHQNGLTTCGAVIGAVGNSFTITDPIKGGLITISIVAAVKNMPVNYSASGGSPFEGRIEIDHGSAGEVEKQILEFNCTTTGNINQMGMYANEQSKPGRDEKVEMYYESTPTWTNTKVEILSYRNDSGNIHRNVTTFVGTAVNEFKVWSAHYHDDGAGSTNYERSYMIRTTGSEIEQKILQLDDIDTDGTFEFNQASGLLLLTPSSGVEEIKFEERKFSINPVKETTGFGMTAQEYPYGSGFNTNTSSGDETLSYNFLINLENSLELL
jgi:hypothetical protein